MKTATTTLEVQQEGQKSRLFRFTEDEITLGFTPGSTLALDPPAQDSPSLTLAVSPERPPILRAPAQCDVFKLNGGPCPNEAPVRRGDVITTGKYRIVLRDLPGETASTTNPPVASSPATAADANDATRPGFLPTNAPPVPSAPEAAPASDEQDDATRPGAVPTDLAAAAATPSPAPAQAAAGAKPAPTAKGGGLSYLYLFFAPVQEHLMDDDVSEVMINGPRQIYVERKGKLQAIPAQFPSEQSLQAAVMNVARSVGRFFDKDNPRLDARLPDGSRVHAVMPPLCRSGTIVAIRKFRRERLTIEQLIKFGSITPEAARVIEIIVKIGKNLIVSGATSSGKTSVLNVLSALIPDHERILVLEDASELQLQQAHKVCFETRKADEHGKGEVTIRDLLHSALRLRPDRIVVGEIRGGEALDLLQAMNTGHEGSMSTIHANSARDALFRLETCSLLSGVEIPLSALREQVASAVHIVIQTARLFDGTRKITGITEVLGLKNQEYQLQDILLYQQEGLDAEGKIKGQHAFTGYQPSFLKLAQQRGFDCTGLFQP